MKMLLDDFEPYSDTDNVGHFIARRLNALIGLSEEEIRSLHWLNGDVAPIKALHDIRMEGDEHPAMYFLLKGWVTSSICLATGKRQVVTIHLAGDIMGASSLPFVHAVDTLTPLTEGLVVTLNLQRLGEIFAQHPRLGGAFFLMTQRKRVALMDNLLMLGCLSARQAFAALLLNLYERTSHETNPDPPSIYIPMNQDQISDVLGISSMHVSRTIKTLEHEGYIRRAGRTFHIIDMQKLRKVARLPERSMKAGISWIPAADAGNRRA